MNITYTIRKLKFCDRSTPIWGLAGKHMTYDVYEQIIHSLLRKTPDIRNEILQRAIK
jgi:hypothetical protein